MDFHVRRARRTDFQGVMNFCLRIWAERDYSETIWDQWQEDPKRSLWVAEQDGSPIGVIRGEILAPGEAWMEGLRVDPASHARGVGSALYSALFEELRHTGVTAIRNLTAIDNIPAHRLVEKHGFYRAVSLKRRLRAVGSGKPEAHLFSVAPRDHLLVQKFLFERGRRVRQSAFLCQTKGLYCVGGVYWKTWSDEALGKHLEAGEVWAWGEGTPRAVAVVTTNPVRPGVWDVGLLEGPRAACECLLKALAVRKTLPRGDSQVPPSIRTFLPLRLDRLQGAAAAAGFRSDRLRHKPMCLWEWRTEVPT